MLKWIKALFGVDARQSPPSPPTDNPIESSESRSFSDSATVSRPSVQQVDADVGYTRKSAADIDALYTSRLLGVHAPVEQLLNPLEIRLIKALKAVCDSPDEAAAQVPRVPAIIPQLLRTLRDEHATSSIIAQTVSQDATLVGEIIRVANSPYYRTSVPITSIEQSVRRLGHNGLRQLIATVTLRPVVNMHGGLFARVGAPHVWKLSETAAQAGQCLARQAHMDPFESFLLGLVHNIGDSVALAVMDQHYDNSDAPRSVLFHRAFERLKRILTLRVVSSWDFPEALTQALGEQIIVERSAPVSPLATVLYAANRIAKVRILVDAGVMPGNVDNLRSHLSGQVTDSCVRCYEALAVAAQA